MDILKWREGYETGIEQMDTEHKKLIGIINQLYQAIRNQESHENNDSILLEMSNYADQHLQAEETLLEEHSYPAIAEQKISHDKYRVKIKELQGEFNKDAKEATQLIYNFLRIWWLNHIVEEDVKYGLFLWDKGVK